MIPELDFSYNLLHPPHTDPDGTWTVPSLSHNLFPFPGDGSLILPLKSIMGFGECGTLDPMKSHPTEHCQEASTSNHKAARLLWPILLATVPAASVNTMGGCWRHGERKQLLLLGSGAAHLWPPNPAAFLHPFKASCQEPQGAELCIRWCKPPTPYLSFPGPSSHYACTGGLFFLQRQEQNFLCSKGALQLQRNSSHFRYQEN